MSENGHEDDLSNSLLEDIIKLAQIAHPLLVHAAEQNGVGLTYTATPLSPDEYFKKYTIVAGLGVSYRMMFMSRGDIANLSMSIEYFRQAVELAPIGHPDRSTQLVILGDLYQSRMKTTHLINLGSAYRSRFKHLDDLASLDMSIECLRKAVALAPSAHPDMFYWVNSLGTSHLCRFERLGELLDSEMYIDCSRQVMALTPDNHPNRPAVLNNLSIGYHARFRTLGDVKDLDMTIKYSGEAVMITPEGNPGKTSELVLLSMSYQLRFGRLGEISDLDRSIKLCRQAVRFAPEGHSAWGFLLSCLGTSHISRFEHLDELTDLDTSIKYFEQAIRLIATRHEDMADRLSNLGSAYRSRFLRLGHLKDLDLSIDYFVQSTTYIPERYPKKPSLLTNLAGSYRTRFQNLGQLVDLNIAIEYFHQVLISTPDVHPDRFRRLSNLAASHMDRFDRLGELPDLETSINCMKRAVEIAPDGNPDRCYVLRDLGGFHMRRFAHLGERLDIDRAAYLFQSAAMSRAGRPLVRLQASQNWAQLSAALKTESPLDAYHRAMELLPQVVWIGTVVTSRYEDVKSFKGLANQAAAIAVEMKAYDTALEWLEQGRSIVWNQIIQFRTSLDDPRLVRTGFASEIHRLALALDGASLNKPITEDHSSGVVSLEQTAQEHRQMASDWDSLIEKIRQIPDFHDFLKPRKIEELAQVAHSSAVVVVNVDEGRCDAIVPSPGQTSATHVPLPAFSKKKCYDMQRVMISSLRYDTERSNESRRPVFLFEADTENQFKAMLGDLWSDIVQPVLFALGYLTLDQINELPRVTWCATGSLSFLPLHAAGCYDDPEARTFNYVVSSYTPSLSALIKPRKSESETKFDGILTVGQASTNGLAALPGTIAELDSIQKRISSLPFARLDGKSATPKSVLDAMHRYPWVHFACHASQDASDPTASAFQLAGGQLTLGTIMRAPLKNAELAFLSACETATGDEQLPDEALHLAAGMLMSGYRTVIGTMWFIRDEDAPIVAERFYSQLLEGGVADSKSAAKALHDATAHLRAKVGEKEFMRWVPYIHLGQ